MALPEAPYLAPADHAPEEGNGARAVPPHAPLEPERVARVAGYGMVNRADGYLYRPASTEEVADVFRRARAAGRRVVLRGAGRSYGDASIAPEQVVLDIGRMRAIRSWDRSTGILEAEAGATVADVWRHTIEDGYWPPVVSGTMAPTLAGALAMNIHGKNNFQAGTLGEHVVELEGVTPAGEIFRATPADDFFYALVSGAGLLAAITRVKLRMKRVHSGDLRVLPLAVKNWEEQFAAFEAFQAEADYMVSWVDCFARDAAAGRGLFHAAWYTKEGARSPDTLRLSHQELPDTVGGWLPKSVMWRFLKAFNHRPGMRLINEAKYRTSCLLGNGKPEFQSLVGFSFLLDYVPNWRWAYLPAGFIQYQSFVPREKAPAVFRRQVELQQEAGLESFLAVLKRHRPDRFLFSHGLDGYSLALDFKVTERDWSAIRALALRMNDLVLEAGGRFYFAKDSLLNPAAVQAYLGEEPLARYRAWKTQVDPEGLLTSGLAERVGLVEPR